MSRNRQQSIPNTTSPPKPPRVYPLYSVEPPGAVQVYCGERGGPNRPLVAKDGLRLTYIPSLQAVLVHKGGYSDHLVPWSGCKVEFDGTMMSDVYAASIAEAYGDG